jgi:hypothetical protein
MAERYADALASRDAGERAAAAAAAVAEAAERLAARAAAAGHEAPDPRAADARRVAEGMLALVGGHPRVAAWVLRMMLKTQTGTFQAALLRDLLGNPFRPAAVNPAWLDWQDGAPVRMAQAIYDGGRFGDLPVLADALEEAGCTDPDILGHCRGPGPHARGCWVVDALLAKA